MTSVSGYQLRHDAPRDLQMRQGHVTDVNERVDEGLEGIYNYVKIKLILSIKEWKIKS